MAIRKRMFAAVYDKLAAAEEPKVRQFRERTAGRADGKVLEIGGGTGLNLPFYGSDVQLTVAEPNPHMARRLKGRAQGLGMSVTIVSDVGERLPFQDGEFDSVVSTLVLCSVGDLPGVLKEARRVLKPGGAFYFFEHVAAETKWKRRFQNWFNGPWRYMGDGCNLNRDIAAVIRQSGFESVEIESVDLPGASVVSPRIVGTARA
ncbi:MAG: class I SAM-dependent methyltransferase [Chloroflexi bacterium]|nr:class I SAM-dependent methyltransferase [Chloroflexota bacterium]